MEGGEEGGIGEAGGGESAGGEGGWVGGEGEEEVFGADEGVREGGGDGVSGVKGGDRSGREGHRERSFQMG